VFQSYALWPHLRVAGNCEFPLKLRRVATAARRARVTEALKLVEMDDFADRYPHRLSGGQQQRVALVRTLYQVDVGGTALRIESDVLFNSGEVWVEIPEASCVLFPAEGCDLS
jgi:ABC-type arginine transport system ATPase subunit